MSDIVDQPPPKPNGSVPVWDLVIADMHERDQVGRERYGTPLQLENGRRHLIDAYQELLDGAAYVRAEIERQNLGLPSHSMKLDEAISQTHKYLHGDDYTSPKTCSEAPCIWLVAAIE